MKFINQKRRDITIIANEKPIKVNYFAAEKLAKMGYLKEMRTHLNENQIVALLGRK